jgi:hypothetical protein
MASIIAARDQENLLHTHQTTAAGKPLNQNVRALQPKTPGAATTPFRLSKNDENALPLGQKTNGKTGPSGLDKNNFVTPLAPRNRAPLGAKTANAKAHAFQTPAPVTTKPLRTQRPSTARRSARSKIKVATSEPAQADILAGKVEEEPDFGYAPPTPVDLPDPAIEFEENPELTREILSGAAYPYQSPKDENGFSIRLKKEEEEWKKFDEERMREASKPIDFPSWDDVDKQVDDMIAAGPKKTRAPFARVNSVEARSAADALSEAPQPRLPLAAMRPTQASEQKKKALFPPPTKANCTVPAPTSNRVNHTALSKNTIGFPKAKKAPSIIPRSGSMNMAAPKPAKIDQSKIHPRDFRDLYGSPPIESDMWFRLKQYELLEAQDHIDADLEAGGDGLFKDDFFPFEGQRLNDEDFQLPMPE